MCPRLLCSSWSCRQQVFLGEQQSRWLSPTDDLASQKASQSKHVVARRTWLKQPTWLQQLGRCRENGQGGPSSVQNLSARSRCCPLFRPSASWWGWSFSNVRYCMTYTEVGRVVMLHRAPGWQTSLRTVSVTHALARHFQEDPRALATWEVLCQPRWQIASVATSSREHALLQIPVNYICDYHYIYSY